MELLSDDKTRFQDNSAVAKKQVLPLHFFYDTSSSFYRVHDDHITEMAATVEDNTRTRIPADFVSPVFTPPSTVNLEGNQYVTT